MIYIPPLKGFVRTFVFICTGVFILQYFALQGPLGSGDLYREFLNFFGLVPERVFKGMIFQPLTWIFLHGTFAHLVFNMLTIWMFGSLLEDTWGSKRFTWFCLVSGFLTGLLVSVLSYFDLQSWSIPTIGASGVIYALLVAVSRNFPNQTVLFFFVFPMKMKYFAYLIIAIEFFSFRNGTSPGVSNLAHLSGAAVGYFLGARHFSGGSGMGRNWFQSIKDKLHQRKMRKKLRVIRVNDRITYH